MVPIKVFSTEGVIFFERHCVFLKKGNANTVQYKKLESRTDLSKSFPLSYAYSLSHYKYFEEHLRTVYHKNKDTYVSTIDDEDICIQMSKGYIVHIECDINKSTPLLSELLLEALMWNQFCTEHVIVPLIPITLLDMDTIAILGNMEFTLLHSRSSDPVSYYYEELLGDEMGGYRHQIVLLRNRADLLTQRKDIYKFVNEKMSFAIKNDNTIEVLRSQNGDDSIYITAFAALTRRWAEERSGKTCST